MLDVAEELKRLREARGLTQGEVAERLGVPKQTLSNWERGYRRPPDEVIERWFDVLGAKLTLTVYDAHDSRPALVSDVAQLLLELDEADLELVKSVAERAIRARTVR